MLAILTLAWAACSGSPSLAPLGGSCTTDTDCMDTLFCDDDVCATLRTGQCGVDSDCAPGWACDLETFLCVDHAGTGGAGVQGGSCGAGSGGAGGLGGHGGAGTGGA